LGGHKQLNITVYHKDVTKGMEEIQTGTIDLIITSPPYWNLKDYNHPKQLGLNITYKHYMKLLQKVLIECMRVIKVDSFICINVGDVRTAKYIQSGRPRIYSIQSSIIHLFEEMDFDLYQHFIWEKNSVKKEKKIHGSVCQGEYKGYAVPPFLYTDLSTEHILVFRKPGIRERSPMEERQRNKHSVLDKKLLQDWLKPVWRINSPPKKGIHKATFPNEVVYRLIKLFSLHGETILDPFVGTGTTLKCANENERKAIGYEINLDYIKPFIDEYQLNHDDDYKYYR
jgi:DNA modification methylase